METFKLDTVLEKEAELLKKRREILFGKESAARFEQDKFGIAMSGGGIRSATINLGFLKTLNLFKILEKADYLSTVSGGGYTGAYVQATLKDNKEYQSLFDESKISRLRSYGNYLVPGKGKKAKAWNSLVLIIGFLVSWIMSLMSPAIVILIALLLFKMTATSSFFDIQDSIFDWNESGNQVMEFLGPALWVLGIVILIHLIINLVLNFNLSISKYLTKVESFIGLVIGAFLLMVGIITIETGSGQAEDKYGMYLLTVVLLFLSGYLLNPNSLSFHRFYRKQLADAFLSHSKEFGNMLLHAVSKPDGLSGTQRDNLAPYPLINTCLNLQNPGGDDKFKGAKASDYFLLSPLFCGAKLSDYVKTSEFPGYKHLTLPAAITISAAAVNPGMGIYSNKLLSILMTLFNARLGFWVNNPMASGQQGIFAWTRYVVWWPAYFFKELLTKIGTSNRKLNISDGGHIENLAVYELLRRKCRLIFSVDAGADPESSFSDLENLSIRARNELGIAITFRKNQDPADIIKPKPSSGYARKRFAVADLMLIWEEFDVLDENGKPIVFTKNIKVKGKPKPKTFKLEALVNYFYNLTDKSKLKFRVDLKAERGVDIPAEQFDELKARAVKTALEKLKKRPGEPGIDRIKTGTLVYIKSSVTPPRKLFIPEYDKDGIKNPGFDTFKYKIYHPEFPQESTADQFFDPVQWESYYQLGQHIAKDVLSVPQELANYTRESRDLSIAEMVAHYDEIKPMFERSEEPLGVIDAFPADAADADLEIARPRVAEVAEAETITIEEDLSAKMAEQMQFKI